MQNGLASPGTGAREAARVRFPHRASATDTESANHYASPEAVLAAGQGPACDYGAALWTVGNDVDFFIEMVRRFVVASPKMMADIAAHLADEELKAVEDAAAALESSLRDLAAKPACLATCQFEMAARQRNLSGAKSAFQAVQHEMARLGPELTRIGRQLTRREF